MKPRVWQIAAGDQRRSYPEIFLRYGVALIGPGDPGPWRPGRPPADFAGGYVRLFATEMKLGDIVLLRTAQSTICAIGIIAGDYEYMPQFDDVNGWDLQHCRRVRWAKLPSLY